MIHPFQFGPKAAIIMNDTAVIRAAYFGFYFYFSRGAPVDC